MEDKEKKGLFEKISNKWSETREKISNKFRSAKEVIKEKFKQTKTKIIVSVGSLVLVAAIALTVACSSGANRPDIDIDNDNDIQYETTIDGEVIGVIKPNNGNIQNDSTKSLESYILNNSEYLEAIASSKAGSDISKTAAFDPHPYAYLAAKGHDVEAIKNGTIECETISYRTEKEPNTLYMATKVYENGVATHYHLVYELPEKTMNVVKIANQGPYLQAAFVNDAVSKLYTPKTETCIKIPKSASKNLDEDFNHIIDIGNDIFSFVTNVNTDDNTLTYIAIPKFATRDQDASRSCDITIYDIKSKYAIESYDNVYDIPHSTNHMISNQITTEQALVYNFQDLNWHYSIPGFENNFKK